MSKELKELTAKIRKILGEDGKFIIRDRVVIGFNDFITLEDIFRVIGNLCDENENLIEYNIDEIYNDGETFQFSILDRNNGDISWKLGKPLHLQNPETINKLNNLI